MKTETQTILQHILRGRMTETSASFGIGDDCSGLKISEDHWQVSTTDCLVENIHFRKSTTAFADLGWKTLAVSVSDILAMGATPTWCHLVCAGGPDFFENHVTEFMDGFYELADPLNIAVQGGDISRSLKDLFLSVTLHGDVSSRNLKKRSGFVPGARVFHVGDLGMSHLGLLTLEASPKVQTLQGDNSFVQAHRRPKVLLSEGRWLAEHQGVLGLMDTSDGVFGASLQLADFFGVSLECRHLEDMVFPEPYVRACADFKVDPLVTALSGGEDYGLLVAVKDNAASGFYKAFTESFATPIYDVGQVFRGKASVWICNEQSIAESLQAYPHT